MANFRDLGGLPTSMGGQVRPGLLFRSEAPAGLSEDDRAELLDLRLVVDLRAGDEAEEEPITWVGSSPEVLALPLMPMNRMYEPGLLLRMSTEEDFADLFMREMYADLVDVLSRRALLELARRIGSEGQVPVLIHCVAGQDRTGVVVAVLLRALGVPREAVIADYARTMHSWDLPRTSAWMRHALGSDGPRVSDRAVARLLAREDRLDECLRYLDDRYGSIEEYWAGGGVDGAALDKLRAVLCTGPSPRRPSGVVTTVHYGGFPAFNRPMPMPSTQCTIETAPATTAPPDQLFGQVGDLPMSMVYTLGLLDAADGSSWFPSRGYFPGTTRSCWPMEAPPGGDYTLAPEAAGCYTGPVTSGRRDETVGFWQPDGTVLLALDGSSVVLQESDFIDLGGEAVGPASRWSAGHPDHPLVYTSRAYRVAGQIRGQAVEGVYFVDVIHAPPGMSLFPSPYIDSMQLAWCSFANELADGTWESGILVSGSDGFNAVCVQHDGQPLVGASALDSVAYAIEDREPAFPQRVTISAGGETFDWAAAPAGRWPVLSHHAEGHRMRRGTVGRVGRTAPVRRSFSLVEGYVDRMSGSSVAS